MSERRVLVVEDDYDAARLVSRRQAWSPLANFRVTWAADLSDGLEHLAAVERPVPDGAAPGRVLLRMRAASLNYRDLLMVRGHYNPRQPLPLVPCSDGVGEVIAVVVGRDQTSGVTLAVPIEYLPRP